MVVEDIGRIIFVELLQMTEYPGSPFTGDITRDLIMFLLVPSVFIILVVYMMVGRILPPGGTYNKLRLLLGVTTYLFIIAGGYYRSFALLAGPYFIFLVFVLGILFFFVEHFTRRGGGGGAAASQLTSGLSHYENMNRQELLVERDRIRHMVAQVDREIREAHAAQAKGLEPATRLEELRAKHATLQGELREIEVNLDVLQKWKRKVPFRM